MDAVNPFSEDNPLVFDIKLEEDIEAELEDFILLTRLGVHREAKEIYHEVLKEHQNLFPVFAELAGFFVELGEMNQLSALLEDLGPTGATFDNSDRRELLSLLSSFAKADVRPTESYKTYLDQWILYLVIHFERRDSKTGRLHALSSAQVRMSPIVSEVSGLTTIFRYKAARSYAPLRQGLQAILKASTIMVVDNSKIFWSVVSFGKQYRYSLY